MKILSRLPLTNHWPELCCMLIPKTMTDLRNRITMIGLDEDLPPRHLKGHHMKSDQDQDSINNEEVGQRVVGWATNTVYYKHCIFE